MAPGLANINYSETQNCKNFDMHNSVFLGQECGEEEDQTAFDWMEISEAQLSQGRH
jgi:hypothetical protein